MVLTNGFFIILFADGSDCVNIAICEDSTAEYEILVEYTDKDQLVDAILREYD